MFDAMLGYRVRRPTYVKRAQIEVRTATRDLNRLVAAGLLDALGQTRGRYYVAAGELLELQHRVRAGRARLTDPYPWIPSALRTGAGR
jgi:hypothetical protein